jgi:hypothetical protein
MLAEGFRSAADWRTALLGRTLTGEELRGAAYKRLFACGSMVLPIYLCFVFALVERKNETQKKIAYRSAEG